MGDPPDPLVTDGDVIDAGEAISITPEKVIAFDAKKHRAETSRVLALLAVGVLGGLIVLQYAAMITLSLAGKADVAIKIADLFQSLLPVTSGLAISAYTYYFTRDR